MYFDIRDCNRLGRVYCLDTSNMTGRMKSRMAYPLVPLDLCIRRQHVNLLVEFSLSGSSHSLPGPFISMRRYQDPAACQRIVSPMGYLIENSMWHDSLRLLLRGFITCSNFLDILISVSS